jgi:hypothetical protein
MRYEWRNNCRSLNLKSAAVKDIGSEAFVELDDDDNKRRRVSQCEPEGMYTCIYLEAFRNVDNVWQFWRRKRYRARANRLR